MNASMFLAQFWGVSFVILSVLFLMRRESIVGYMKSVMSEPGILFIAGYVSLSMGIASILVHNVWTLNWRGIVTLMGWLALVKGITLLGFPNTTKKFTNLYKNDNFITVAMFIMLIIGIYLVIQGFGL
ncbi:hypothetical protein KBB89_04090 [Candidatus Gracilibacteria bacterium]|nr:hypothetical protein [Candidatus Gracilibacteria bacterium]